MKNIHIRSLDLELTEAIENYFKEKLDTLDRLIDQDDESINCDARVGKTAGNMSGNIFRAEVSLHTSGKNYGAVSDKENLYVAIDDVVKRVSEKIVAHKGKKRSLFLRGAQKIKKLLKGSE